MDAVIVSCGTELTTGQCVDTNTAWFAARLTSLGVRVTKHVTVADDVERLAQVIRRAFDEADLVMVSGGLGPTPDDITREAIAAALSVPLEENPEALAQIQAFFERWRRPMPFSNRRQAMIPRGCEVIPNPRGTAPGIRYRSGNKVLYAFPGIPAELQIMFDAAVVPAFASLPAAVRTVSARLHCFGLSEARLGELLADLMQPGRNPMVGTTASRAVLTVRILATAARVHEAEKLLAADVAEVRRRLGDLIFGDGDETLQSVVAALLKEHGRTLAVAESCTGGLLAKRMTDTPGSSGYFLRGYVTYDNDAKVRLLGVPTDLIVAEGAVSREVAEAMARGCRVAAQSDWAIAITGIAGPAGGNPPAKPVGLVYIAVADALGVSVEEHFLGEHLNREEIRDRACKSALNRLRLRLLKDER